MIYVYHGDDDYGRQLAVDELKAAMGDPATASLNITALDGDDLTIGRLQEACDALPFLAERRLVLVRGLLQRFEPRREPGMEGSTAPRPKRDKDLEDSLKSYLVDVPDSTDLVFVEDKFSKENPFFGVTSARGNKVEEFRPVRGEALNQWIRDRVRERGAQITPQAVTELAAFVGDHLRALSHEIDKLISYTGGARAIREDDVRTVVSAVQEATIFQLVDAVGLRNGRRAVADLHTLLDAGANANYVLFMITRQVRMLLQIKELATAGAAPAAFQSALHLHPFVLQKGQEQARGFSLERLEAIYRQLLEVDSAIKRGRAEPELALDILVAELAGSGQSVGGRRQEGPG